MFFQAWRATLSGVDVQVVLMVMIFLVAAFAVR
jgi:hypothetical protein